MRRQHPSPGSIAASAILHLSAIGFLVSDFGLASCGQGLPVAASPERPNIVTAEAISEKEIDKMYQVREEAERKKQAAAELKRKEAEERQARLREERLAEQKRQKQEQERKQAEQLRLEKAKREARLAEEKARREKREQLEKERQAKAKAEAERKAKEEAERKAKEEAERKAKEEAERKAAEIKRQAEEERKRAHARKVALWTRQYILDIRRSIEKNWTKPPASVRGGDCVVRIKQSKSGKLLDVTIVKCDGDRLYQLSVKSAVHKTNPLPAPPSRDVFDDEIEITFKQQY